ncbi:3-oxo-5-alpha-steroid 4-dehydrogenase family protein [Rhynchospora pubera]|uniref:3-oxo-5-alpha-steroid 4-dehydrogenase family protein n=2 Tax=Rhynchospora pubera TaxID=906938 RepID=A0AAV8H8Z2_9POAL|nr:3-oxo-5-alpha-steroid 4-dehydrogenase family protein [Rhynchospora pubera]
MNIFQSIIYPPPPSLFLNVMTAVCLIVGANLGISEARGTHMAYSKFWNWKESASGKKSSAGTAAKVSGRTGMLLLYTPALVAAVVSFFLPGVLAAPRGVLVCAVLGLHFLKRDLEILFIHKFSGYMMIDSAILISFTYFTNTVLIIGFQYLSTGMPEPDINLTYAGIVLFFIGITGNFYHHYLLSKLRERGDKAYKIPTGGLFNLVICPHYLFEIIDLFGIALVSQTLHSYCFAFGSMFYLMGRSVATRNWYMSKFENFRTGVKALVPYIF